ncbi:FtsW/RodA/SpoVE family cell cycle protein, partial [Acinetobacter baumannii]
FFMQLVFWPLGILVGFGLSKVKPERWQRLAPAIWAVTFIALILVFVPGLRATHNGGLRWIKSGPLLIQPAEFAKITVILFLASVLAD